MGDAIGVPIYYLGSYKFSCVYLSGTGHGPFFKYLNILFRGCPSCGGVVSSAIVNGFGMASGRMPGASFIYECQAFIYECMASGQYSLVIFLC